MDSNLKMLFYLKKPKNYQVGPMPIYFRITLDGPPKEMSTTMKCLPADWDNKTERFLPSAPSAISLNEGLEKLENKAKDTYRYLSEMEPETIITAQRLKDRMKGIIVKKKTLLEVFQEHNDQVEALVGKVFSKGTFQRYNTSYSHTLEFIKQKYGSSDIAISQVNHEFIAAYDFYLRTERECNNNTTVKYIKNFKKIILICLASGYISVNPFLNYKGKIKKVKKDELSSEQIECLANKDFKIERLSQVRDVFLFSCYTGLSYIDVYNLRPSDIVTGVDGELWIDKDRQKSGINSLIPLLPCALTLIEKYKSNKICLNRNRVFPVSSNQKMNAYLKEIGDICEFINPLNYGKSRHTFATTITLSNNVPIETVSKMMGHTNIRTTQIYARVVEKKISTDMKVLKQKMGSLK